MGIATDPTIVVDCVRYRYPPPRAGLPEVEALRDVSFSLRAGQTLAIAGPLGAGKTTLCLALAALVPHCTGGAFGGAVLIRGLDTRRHSPASICRHVGIVLENADAQLLTDSVEDEVAFGLESLCVPRYEMPERVDWALDAVGLSSERGRSPRHLSGGQKQRLALAAALAMRPEVLVLDEPTANLDPAAAKSLAVTLRKLSHDDGTAIVVAGEDTEWQASVADRFLILRDGWVALDVPATTIVDHAEALEAAGLATPDGLRLSRLVRQQCEVFPLCSGADDYVRAVLAVSSLASQGTRDSIAAGTRCANEVRQVAAASAPVLEAREVCFRYPDGPDVLARASLVVSPGEALALVGQNGSGKTTLAKHFIGLLRPASGQVLAFGADTARALPGELARRVGFAFQNPDHQLFSPSVREEIAFGPSRIGRSRADVAEAVEAALETFRLGDVADVPPATLGFGLRKLVALASVIAMRPDVLVLDEPLAGMGWDQTKTLVSALTTLSRGESALMLVTHDMRAVAELADEMAVMGGGHVAARASPAEVFERGPLLAASGLEPPAVAVIARALRDLGFGPRSLRTEDLVRSTVALLAASTSQPEAARS